MKKFLAIGIMLLFIGMTLSSSANLELKKQSPITTLNGSIFYVGGSGPGNYTRIQDAVDNTSDGDTVFVYDDLSPYYESVQINKSIDLIGEDRNTTVIDANGGRNVIFIESDNVSIHEFTLQNGSYGIEIAVFFGFCIVSDNNIIDNNFGITSFKSRNNIIEDNTFFDNKDNTISMYGKNMTISGNTIDHSTVINTGLNVVLYLGPGSNISGNTIKNGDRGISMGKSDNVIVSNNEISSNERYGILIGGSNNTIIGNNISYNGIYGIFMYDDRTNDNVIYHNNLIYNSQNARDNGNNSWDDGEYGNYWSDYKEWYPEAKKKILDGIWDTPYEMPGEGNNKDMCPLIKEWPDPVSKPSQNNEYIWFYRCLDRYPILHKMLGVLGIFYSFYENIRGEI